jgi:hypothetical protein
MVRKLIGAVELIAAFSLFAVLAFMALLYG